MPKVRAYTERQVQQSGAGTPYQNISAPAAAFGALEADALVKGGESVADAGHVLSKRAIDEAKENAAYEADDYAREAEEALNEVLWNKDNGLMTRQRSASFSAVGEVDDHIRKVREKALMRASNPMTRRLLNSALDKVGAGAKDLVRRHVFQESQAYKGEVIDNRIRTDNEGISYDPLNDANFEARLRSIKSAVYAKAAHLGVSGDEKITGMMVRDETSKAIATRLLAISRSEQPADIMRAYEFYKDRDAAGEIAITERGTLENFFDAAVPKAKGDMKFAEVLTSSTRPAGAKGDYVTTLAKLENAKGDPNAVPRDPKTGVLLSSAKGYYQWTNGTAEQYGLLGPGFDYRGDRKKEDEALARFTEDNRAALFLALGREPSDAELYLAHQQGADGAAELLANPNARAADIVGEAAVVNNGGSKDMTAGQFARKWIDRWNRAAGGSGGSTSAYVDMRAVHEQAAKLEEETPGAGAHLIARAEKYNNDIDTARTQRAKQVEEEGMTWLEDNGYDFASMPTPMRAAAKEARVEDKLAAYAKQGGVDDPDAVLEIDLMTTDQFAQADFSQYPISRATRAEYEKKQKELADPKGEFLSKQIDGLVSLYFALDDGALPDSDTDKAKIQAMKNYVSFRAQELIKADKFPSKDEMNKYAAEYFALYKQPTWYGGTSSVGVDDFDLGDFSEEDQQAVIQGLVAADITPDPASVLSTLIDMKRAGKIK